jgi:hypothetical protein
MKNEEKDRNVVPKDRISLEQKWIQLNRELILSKFIKKKYIAQTEITYTDALRIILKFSNSKIILRAVFDTNKLVIDLTQIQVDGVNTLKPNLPKRLEIDTNLHS